MAFLAFARRLMPFANGNVSLAGCNSSRSGMPLYWVGLNEPAWFLQNVHHGYTMAQGTLPARLLKMVVSSDCGNFEMAITLEFHVFEPYANRLNAIRLSADDYASSLARVAGSSDIRVIERALPATLAERPVASFMWPLGKEPVFQQPGNERIVNPMDRRGQNALRSK